MTAQAALSLDTDDPRDDWKERMWHEGGARSYAEWLQSQAPRDYSKYFEGAERLGAKVKKGAK